MFQLYYMISTICLSLAVIILAVKFRNLRKKILEDVNDKIEWINYLQDNDYKLIQKQIERLGK